MTTDARVLAKEARVAFAAYTGLGRNLIDQMASMLESQAAERDRLKEQNKMLLEALEWYSEKAVALSRNDWKKNLNLGEAIFTELMLDGGKRAALAAAKAKP